MESIVGMLIQIMDRMGKPVVAGQVQSTIMSA